MASLAVIWCLGSRSRAAEASYLPTLALFQLNGTRKPAGTLPYVLRDALTFTPHWDFLSLRFPIGDSGPASSCSCSSHRLLAGGVFDGWKCCLTESGKGQQPLTLSDENCGDDSFGLPVTWPSLLRFGRMMGVRGCVDDRLEAAIFRSNPLAEGDRPIIARLSWRYRRMTLAKRSRESGVRMASHLQSWMSYRCPVRRMWRGLHHSSDRLGQFPEKAHVRELQVQRQSLYVTITGPLATALLHEGEDGIRQRRVGEFQVEGPVVAFGDRDGDVAERSVDSRRVTNRRS